MARAKGERDELRRLAGESVRLNAELREIYGGGGRPCSCCRAPY
jgi:hypothetical protein